MDTFKKINIIVAVVFGLVAIGIWEYWTNICASAGCDSVTREFIFRPLLWGSAVWAILFTTLLAFPSSVFKKWLYFVAVWGLLWSVYAVLATDPRAPGPFLIDRGRAAWFIGIFIGMASVLFILGWYALARYRRLSPPAPYSRLIALILAGAVLYALSVI